MTTYRTPSSLEDLVGNYGPDWRPGVLSDDLYYADQVDAVARVAPSTGRLFLTSPAGGRAVPVLCGWIIRIDTEDGPIDGRCGGQVYGLDGFACPGHEAERRGWAAQSDAETVAWERRLDEEVRV